MHTGVSSLFYRILWILPNLLNSDCCTHAVKVELNWLWMKMTLTAQIWFEEHFPKGKLLKADRTSLLYYSIHFIDDGIQESVTLICKTALIFYKIMSAMLQTVATCWSPEWLILTSLYPPLQLSWKGGILVSPCPSVHLWTESCPLCIFNNTHRIHFIFAHLILKFWRIF